MQPHKLDAKPVSYEIAGVPYRVGKLTLGAAFEIETFLSKLKSPYEILEDSKALAQVGKELADQLVNKALQDCHFWPPDAINALCNKRFLTRADFGIAFVSAMIRQGNPHLPPDEVTCIAHAASYKDVMALQLIAFGADDTDPKDENGVPERVATPNISREPIGPNSSRL
ncbi:hypothetical protein UFOVP1622_56 [uncultured Caudovirales phage]|uniref:Uncharacterized protein n=1 Tax=uncultured Caudovirales phage TaxID=2100421 RepID=A0A6J5Q2M2_9CAUD|nr:hypothetical protein UFOVP1021_35 [uncultured Caudovirales phage]CAB4219738.1 hypothetical protein UFOVP1622_56 [uncultured Caudovirales phage]